MPTDFDSLMQDEKTKLFNARETSKRLQRVAFMQEFQRRGVIDKTFITCANCDDFNKDQQMCMRFNSRPPADVIVTGCEYWDAIPF